MSENRVVAVIATYRRPFELERLLFSLCNSAVPLHGLVVTDNAGDEATRSAVENCGIPFRLVVPGANLGCGGGLKRAEETALQEFPTLTHVWVLDDDVTVGLDTLGNLLGAMAVNSVGAACPMCHDAEGKLGWYPGLTDRKKFRVLCKAATPSDYLQKCGDAHERFTWATGVCLLVSRPALESGGLHRDDFWIRGEDLDFALRVTHASGGVFVPHTLVPHLPPGGGKVVYNFAERMKHAAMLQNCSYLATRTEHGRSIAKNLPGNAFRHLRWFGLRAVGDVLRAVWLGAFQANRPECEAVTTSVPG